MPAWYRSRVFRYVVATICVLLAIGTLPSVYFLSVGLASGGLSEYGAYFLGKLIVYIVEILVLSYIAWRLFSGPRTQNRTS